MDYRGVGHLARMATCGLLSAGPRVEVVVTLDTPWGMSRKAAGASEPPGRAGSPRRHR